MNVDYVYLLLTLFWIVVLFSFSYVSQRYKRIKEKRRADFLVKRKLVYNYFKVTDPSELTNDSIESIILKLIGDNYRKLTDIQKVVIRAAAARGYMNNPNKPIGKHLKYM
ncbi:hypothetical protein [Pseudomonas phage U1B]|nr:hypothetical protein [Pseudomonas phage T2P]QYV99427.1 hypothetical protein [Pseudomonas phage U1B]QYV99517.1 putative DNA methylase [Pseudomonas phage U5]BDR27031.1 hypothetical protein RVBP20_2720 [Pseudomonas phage sp. NK1]